MLEISDETWEFANEKYKEMCNSGKQVFFFLREQQYNNEEVEQKQYYIWDFNEADHEIWLIPLEYCAYGSLCFRDNEQEMIVDDYALTEVQDFEEDVTELVINDILDKDAWVDAKWIELKKEDGDDRDWIQLVKLIDPLPENATGKFLKWDFGQCRFVYEDGSAFEPCGNEDIEITHSFDYEPSQEEKLRTIRITKDGDVEFHNFF